MSQGKAGGLTRQKSRQSNKNRSYYERHFAVTNINKLRRKARLRRWLDKRQSPEVRERMAMRWMGKHPVRPADATHHVVTVSRYGCHVLTTTRTRGSYAQ